MGLTSVAVLHNDMVHQIERDGGELGKRLGYAMKAWDRVSLDGYFVVGRIISRDHSSASQVVIVRNNTGCHITDAKDVDHNALYWMADCLKRHGWSAKPPRKARAG